MQAPSRVTETVELVKKLCLAVTNSEAYSSRHPVARRAIEEAFAWLASMLSRRSPVVLSVSDKRIILDGLPLEDRNPLVARLGAKLADYHISNLFLKSGPT
jgi:hypothetical protein